MSFNINLFGGYPFIMSYSPLPILLILYHCIILYEYDLYICQDTDCVIIANYREKKLRCLKAPCHPGKIPDLIWRLANDI